MSDTLPFDMEPVALEAEALLPVYPGPAVLFDAEGRALDANRAADLLLAALSEDRLPALAAAIDATLEDGLPRQDKADLPGLRGGSALQITLLPYGGMQGQAQRGQRRLLLLGRDNTLERNMLQALMQSRQLFRDLVACSTDFAWETKPDGRFGFVSPRGALGYSARELEGHVPEEFAAAYSPEHPRPSRWPFTAQEAMSGVEVFLRFKDGAVGCFEVSCMPAKDAAGAWSGARGVARDVTEARERVEALRRAHKQLNALANTDGLTGLLNRRAFIEELEKRLARHYRNRLVGTLIYFDLDNFKKVNDQRGHQAGDEVLKAVAEAARHALRVVDLASRIGGDEFLLWLEETGPDAAKSIADRLMEAAAGISKVWGVEGYPLGFSIGAVFARLDMPESAESLIARADAAMYVAKKGGKGQLHIAELPGANG